MVSSHFANKGPMWLEGLSMIAQRRGLFEMDQGDDGRGIYDVEQNLRGITMGVPSM